jgi:hypothetical protein
VQFRELLREGKFDRDHWLDFCKDPVKDFIMPDVRPLEERELQLQQPRAKISVSRPILIHDEADGSNPAGAARDSDFFRRLITRRSERFLRQLNRYRNDLDVQAEPA